MSDVVSVGDVKYVLKLDSVKTADLSKLSDKKVEELAEGKADINAYWLFNSWISSAEKSYEKKGLIYKNPDFVNYDAIMEANQREREAKA